MRVRRWPDLRPRIYGCSGITTRLASSSSSPPHNPNPAFARLLSRTPRFLHPTVSALHNAPVTHVTAFLLLHEVTAVVPLFGLAGLFHYYHWLPQSFAQGATGYVDKFARYFRRKGWIGEAEEEQIENHGAEQRAEAVGSGVRWVIEFATAYAVVKALLPLRIVLSVWGAPWFARWTVIPVGTTFRRLFGKSAQGSNVSKVTGRDLNVSPKSGSAEK